MYYRLYPSKNNTIFRNTYNSADESWSLTANTGASPIMELQDGAGESKLMFDFVIPDFIREKITNNNYSCNFRLYDAGALYTPLLSMKNVSLDYFVDDFSEGNGFSFTKNTAKSGVSNWLYRQDGYPWAGVSFFNIDNYHLNRDNEDLTFNVKPAFDVAIMNSISPKFALRVSSHADDVNVCTKFIFSSHTKTVFKPFIEFFIEDTIKDDSSNLVAQNNNRIYFINESGEDFSGAITAAVKLNNGQSEVLTAEKVKDGVYYIIVIPSEPGSVNKKEYVEVVWNIDGEGYYKQTILVRAKNQIMSGIDKKNLFFYPTTSYSHNNVRQGDIIPFDVVSQIRGYGDVPDIDYEYKVISSDGFEMVPWTDVSIYRNKMFFYVDTSFFFPELTYEVILRSNKPNYTISSNTTFKFKLVIDAQSHLRTLSTSPYYSRESFFSK